MFCEDVCLGVTCGIDRIRNFNDQLNAKVVDQVNGSQELVLLSDFARESSEYQFKHCLQDRISDVASWRWVLEDLSKRLEDAIKSLKHEHNALRVVQKRVQDEMDFHSRDASRPGVICPLTDIVEEAIIQEFEYLRGEKKKFEKLIVNLDKQTSIIEKTKKQIDVDVLNKIQALSVEEMCANKDYKDVTIGKLTKKRKKGAPVYRWKKRCATLKRAGLKGLCNALVTRQQIRGARIQLSIAAQAYAARIDTVLRRRMHTNNIKLQDLKWQREEAIRDYTSLDDELISIEKTLVETMEKERIMEARLSERSRRPLRELTKDDANKKLREEQTRLRKFTKELRNNIKSIAYIQNDIIEAVGRIDCCAEDLAQVISLDEERIRCRQGEQDSGDTAPMPAQTTITRDITHVQVKEQLSVINEEDEDDYPFDF